MDLVDKCRTFDDLLLCVFIEVRDYVLGGGIHLAVCGERGQCTVRILQDDYAGEVKNGGRGVRRLTILRNLGSKLAPSARLTTLVSMVSSV